MSVLGVSHGTVQDGKKTMTLNNLLYIQSGILAPELSLAPAV